jgi:hypothetical protein
VRRDAVWMPVRLARLLVHAVGWAGAEARVGDALGLQVLGFLMRLS